jgi:hypothetical protein
VLQKGNNLNDEKKLDTVIEKAGWDQVIKHSLFPG